MAEEKADSKDKIALQFLLAEHELTAEERWKYSERAWEVFKFYITLVTGTGGLVLALTSLGSSVTLLTTTVSIAAGLLLIVGATVYIQLVDIGFEQRRVDRRLNLVRQQIVDLSTLQDYLKRLHSADADFDTVHKLGYSPVELVKRATKGAGLKTQMAIINSLIGVICLTTGVLASGVAVGGSLLLIGVVVFVLIILLHILYANLAARRR